MHWVRSIYAALIKTPSLSCKNFSHSRSAVKWLLRQYFALKKKRFLGKGNRSAQNLTEFNCLGTSVIVYPASSLHLRVVSWRAQSTARHFTHTHTHTHTLRKCSLCSWRIVMFHPSADKLAWFTRSLRKTCLFVDWVLQLRPQSDLCLANLNSFLLKIC